MRIAGAIAGLMVLGSFVIPGTYTAKRHFASSAGSPDGTRVFGSPELDMGSATLGGRVFDERGRPVAGAIVSLAGSGFWPARAVQSGADGRFHWSDIPVGIYELRVSNGPLVAPPIEGLILDAGAHRAFGVKLGRGWTLRGHVVDERTGTPVPAAEVTAATGALGLHTRRTESDLRGRFTLEGIIGDEQSLYVDADGYLVAGPLTHTIESGELLVRLKRASRIEGRVVDESGRAIAGAWVRALGEEARPSAPGADSLGVTAGPVPPISAAEGGTLAFVGQATTQQDGGFLLGHLPPGSYTIAASHDDFAPSQTDPIRVDSNATLEDIRVVMRPGAELAGRVVDERGRGLESIPVALSVPEEQLPRMAVTASDGSFSFKGVRGKVSVTALPYDLPAARTSATIAEYDALVTVELALTTSLFTMHGRVVDERGFGVGGALITVISNDPRTPTRRNAKSDTDGTFSVPALPEPPYSLSAEHPAFSETRLSRVDEVDDVRVVLSAGVIFVGRLRDDWTGDGLPNARVRLEGPTRTETKTRDDGTFVFRQLPTGTYEVTLSHPDYETQTRRVVIEPPRYVDRPQELETVRLEPGGVVEGEVLDASGDPVPGAEVTWGDPPRWSRAALTDARGSFQLRGVPAGSVWITARHGVAGESWTDGPIQVRPLETSPGALIRLPNAATE
jgi:protocatechuate 3,4-dioxygenase beta subunit